MTPWQKAEIVHAIETVFGPYEARELIAALPTPEQKCDKCGQTISGPSSGLCFDCWQNTL